MTNPKFGNNQNKNAVPIRSKIYVKYMVCLRDKLSVQSILNKQGFKYKMSVHGAIDFLEEISQAQFFELKMNLFKADFILLDEEESILIDRIINMIVEVIHYSETLPKLKFRDIINSYAISGDESILKIFSDVKGMSVLQFIIIQKIERAKELMLYDDMPLSEIAEILHYKNEHLMFAQFKKVTGLTPSYYKRLKKERTKIVEELINEIE
jgi:AraC-like DNA-binding protein